MNEQRKKYLQQCTMAMLSAFLLLLSGCGSAAPTEELPETPVAMVQGKDFCLRGSDGSYTPAFLNGVNIGASKPGYFPGEFGITEDDYLRWFQQISDMHVQVIRVYVGQMPAFYDALEKFNRRAEQPLYLMQGVYMNEDAIAQYNDAFAADSGIQESFYADICKTVDMIHGNAEIEKQPGNAGGVYKADVSQWTIGWILGVEWSADFVQGTNDAHAEQNSFAGDYVQTVDASPFEVFLAGAAEEAISYEMSQYQQQRPVALSNWCTTDPLTHPNEPCSEMEDAVSVDTEHIQGTDAFTAGFFASYHVYPYYPDFLSYDTKYQAEGNPYRAYLQELNSHHTMPLIVSEYGIPTSRGSAHRNAVTGMSQGQASEAQQGQWLIELNQDIRKAGCAGGFIFAWQDEWFKRTWNSMDYEAPDRRPFWYNVESPEECFGLLTFEAGKKKTAVTVDGNAGEWSKKDLLTEQDGLRLSVKSDAAYLYLLIEGDDYDFAADTLYVPLSVLEGQGNTRYQGQQFADGADFLLRLHGAQDSALLVDAYYDVFQYDYAERNEYYPLLPGQLEKNSGQFHSIYLAMNKPLYLPETDETTAFERLETGKLHYGNADPNSADYDSLADFCAAGNVVEVRLPWMLLGFMDPSQKQVLGDFHALGGFQAAATEGVCLGIGRADSRTAIEMSLYSWETWDMPSVHERLKQSYFILQKYFAGETN